MWAQLLERIGVGGQVIVLLGAGYLVWNIRKLFTVGETVGAGLKIAMAIILVVGVGMSGLFPGFHVTLNPQAIIDLGGSIVNRAMEAL